MVDSRHRWVGELAPWALAIIGVVALAQGSPPSLTFTASAPAVAQGKTVTLRWSAPWASTCTASGGWSGQFGNSGSRTSAPLSVRSTEFTLVCEGQGSTVTRKIAVEALPAPTLTISANKPALNPGGSIELTWQSEDATACTASGGWSGAKALDGRETLDALTKGTKTYTLSCRGVAGTVRKSAVVIVSPEPEVTLTATPTAVLAGKNVTLRWSSKGASSCTASGAWSGTKAKSGSESVGPLTEASYNYTITCTGPGGADATSTTVQVVPPPTATLYISDEVVAPGAAVTLDWSSTDATSCRASGPGWSGTKATTGRETLSGLTRGKKAYSITCTGGGGTAKDSRSLDVVAPPALTFTASAGEVASGATVTLRWSSKDATTCTSSKDWSGDRGTSGSFVTPPLTKAENFFTLACTGSNGTDTETVQVSVRAAPTVTLTTSAAIVEPKGAVTLTWSATDAQSCKASGAWRGDKAAQGSETVGNLTAGPKVFGLVCSGAGGKQSAERRVAVAFAPTVNLSASPLAVNVGESATLEWTTTDADSCIASGDWSGPKNRGTRIKETVSSLSKRINTFTLTCRGEGGETSATQEVVGRNAPTVNFAATSILLTPGQRAELEWSSSQATRCEASDRWSGTRPLSGRFTSDPLTVGAYTYRLACDNGTGGSDVKSITVEVIEPVIKAAPTSITFSNLAVGVSSAERTVTLTNTSRVALPIGELKVGGTHSLDFPQKNDCGGVLAAGASCRVTVSFKPTATGTRIAELSLSSSALSTSFTVKLTGVATGNSVAASKVQSIDVKNASAFILAKDSRTGALARLTRRGLRLNVGPLDEIAIESPRLYKVDDDNELVEVEFKDSEGVVITQDEVTVVGVVDLENYVITRIKDSTGVTDLLVDKTSGAAYRSTGLEWASPKVLANGDIVARRGDQVFFVDASNLGTGALRAEFLPSIDAISEFEVSDTDNFLVYSGTNRNSGRSACRIVDLRKKEGETGRLRDVADFVPEGATSRWDNCLWFWHPTERALYFADYRDFVPGLRRDTIEYIRIQRNETGELVRGQRLDFGCAAPNRGEFAQSRLAYFSMCTHSVGRSTYLRSRGQWVAGRYVYGQEYMWPTVIDVEKRVINHLDTLNEAVCSNCGNDYSWWYKTFTSDNYVWMFGLDRNTSRDIVGQLNLDTGETRSIRISEVDVAEIFPLSDDKILFKGDRLSDVSKVVGTLSVSGDVFVNEVYPYITAAGAEIVPVNPDTSYKLLRYNVDVQASSGGTATPVSAAVLIDRVASFALNPEAGFEVDTASGCNGKRNGNSYTTGKISADCTINVSFKKRDATNANSVDLTIIKTGSGAIKSTPAGVDCGTSCAVAFEKNKVVSLLATPAAGQTFSGWGGACSGTARTCSVTMSESRGVTATFTAVGSGPRLVVSSASVAFGAIAVGARSAVKEITLANEGTAALTISSIALNGDDVGQFVQTNDCGNGIAAGGSCILSLLFAPDSEGLKRTQVSIGSNAGNPQLIDLEGTGTPAPIVGFDVPSLTFGDVDIGQSADRTVTLANTGGAALVLSGITVSGDDAAQFSRTTTCLNGSATLAPGARCTVALKFKPGTAGAKSAVMVVDSNAAGSPTTLAMRGNGVGARVAIEASPKVVKPGGKATLTWSSNAMTRCTANGAWSGSRALSGSIETPALSETARFGLTCEGPLGTRGDEAEVLVSANLATAVSLSVKTAPVAGTISTMAGIGPSRYNGDDIPAIGAGLSLPTDVLSDGSGNLYITDTNNHRVRRVDAVSGLITTVAGYGERGFTGDGGAATEALLSRPWGVARDPAGNLYIAEHDNHRIRKVTPSGVITSLAGSSQGFSGDGGPATRAQFQHPWALLFDSGSLYVADRMNHRIRRIDLATGVVSTIAGTGQAGFSGDGGPATQAQLNQPYRMLIDKAGDLLFSDKSNNRVRKIARATGVITTVAGDGQRGGEPTRSIAEAGGLAMTADGSVYVADEAWCFIRRLIPGSTTMEVVAGCDYSVFGNVHAMTVDRSGGLLLADSANGRIRRLDPATKTIATLVGDVAASFGGDGGPAAAAGLNRPNGLAHDRAGNIYLSDQSNGAIRRIDAQTGRISTIWRGGCPGAITIDRQQQLYAADSCENHRVIKLNLASGESSIISGFKSAGTGIAVDSVGNIYVSESNQHKVLRVDAQSGAISTFAGNGKDLNDGDGGPATAASLRWPFGLWVDTNDNLYIAARNNQVIRRVDARTGLIATVAGSNAYGYSGDGGSSTAAAMRNPHGIAMDSAGNLLIVDSVSNVVRFVEAASGRISTMAGSGLRGFAGDYGPAVQARLDEPENVLVDRTGNVLITDMANNRVRFVHCAAQPQPGFVRDCVAGASSLYAGQRVWVSWNVLGASSCTASGAWSGAKSAVGGEWVLVKTAGAQDFKLDCTGLGGSTSGISARAEVVTNPLRVTLSTSSLSVKFGEKVRLSWSAVNATSCVARGTWSGNKVLSGQEESVALDSQSANEFVLTCTGATGSVSETVTVNVVDQSPSLNISASAVSVRRGETVRLDWTSQRATRCVASGGWGGSRAVSGSFTTSPLTAASTSFALVCQGATGTVRDEVTVVTTDATAGNAGPQISLAVRRPVTGTISTVAGQGPVAYEVETAPALEMMLNGPHGLARDAGGNLYIAEAGNHVVRRVSAATGEIAIVAGRGIPGGDGDGGLATEARLSYPTNLAFDSVGNLYIADQGNNRIRVVDRVSGVIRTVAGNGSSNFSGDGGLATLAALRSPTDVAFDATGNLYITDWGNARIRRVDVATRLISTFAGTGNAASSGDGGNALQADINPYGLAIDGRGDLVFTEINQHRVRRIDQSTRTVRTIAGTGTAGFSGDGGPAISAALSTPHGISIDTAGNVFVGDASNYRIRRIDPAGTISTFAGGGNAEENGTSATDVRLTGRPIDVVMGDSGLWYTEFESGRVRKIDSSTLVVTTVAGGARPGFGGDGGPAISASLNAPNRVARDSKGNLYIGDIDNQRIRRIDGRTGVVSTVISSVLPGLPLTPGGIAFDAADNLYFSEQRSNRVWRIGASDGVVVSVAGTGSRGYGGDGGLATSAILNEPGALRFDADGNLLIAEPGNLRVRKVTMATGIITTIAGTGECCGDADDGQLANASRLAYPSGIAVDRNRNVYIADRSNRVRKVDVAGVITTIAGNRNGGYSGENVLASNASLQIPSSVAVDSQGNVFFTEEEGYRVRKVERATGRLTTIAGNGERGFGGDGGSATSARFDNFRSDELIVDPSGNLLITDTRNNRVRVVHCAAAAESGITSDCASTAALAAGDRVQVSWSVTGATQCVASGAWRGEKRVSGGEWLWLGAGNRRYTLTCTGPGGVTVKDIDVTVALSAATDSGIAAVVPPTAPSRTGLARSSTLEISLTGIAQNGSRAPVVSETEVSTDVATQGGGGRYVIVGESNASADQRRWLLQRRETGDGVSAERELPKTQDVLWRRKSGAGVPLPSTAWVRQCGATVYTVQDGYRLQLTAWDAELANGWQSEITLGETGRSTLLTEVACAGDALRVTGHSLGINEFEPSLDSVMDDARRFSAILVRGRSEPTEADWGDSPFSVAAFCASSSRERATFCARYRDVPAN